MNFLKFRDEKKKLLISLETKIIFYLLGETDFCYVLL